MNTVTAFSSDSGDETPLDLSPFMLAKKNPPETKSPEKESTAPDSGRVLEKKIRVGEFRRGQAYLDQLKKENYSVGAVAEKVILSDLFKCYRIPSDLMMVCVPGSWLGISDGDGYEKVLAGIPADSHDRPTLEVVPVSRRALKPLSPNVPPLYVAHTPVLYCGQQLVMCLTCEDGVMKITTVDVSKKKFSKTDRFILTKPMPKV